MARSAGELLGAVTVPILLLAGVGVYVGGAVTGGDLSPWWLLLDVPILAGIVFMGILVWRALDRIPDTPYKTN